MKNECKRDPHGYNKEVKLAGSLAYNKAKAISAKLLKLNMNI